MQIYEKTVTPTQAIKAAGGATNLAAAFGCHPNTVNNWVRNNAIPKDAQLIIANLLYRDEFGLEPLPDILDKKK